MQKIICTGPESTGKTTLSQQLANHFHTSSCPEFARLYLENLADDYSEKDLLKIAKGQLNLEQEYVKKAKQFLICDTSFLVLKVWSEYKFGRCHSFIINQFNSQQNDFFILCGTEIKWEFDPLREHPNERAALYEIYKRELEGKNLNFIEVFGSQEDRLNFAIEQIKNRY